MLEQRLRSHVERIAGRPRVPGTTEHAHAASYIREQLERCGFAPRVHGTPATGDNIVASYGAGPRVVVVGAHYDSVEGSPGADDNASGVAALLEVARLYAEHRAHESGGAPPVRIDFVAFDREEEGLVGSRAYVAALRREAIDVRGMMSLEMLGFTAQDQTFVPGVSIRSTQGDFLAVVADERSEPLLAAFQSPDAFPPAVDGEGSLIERVVVRRGTEAAALARLSDHGAFWEARLPALLVTDTAFLRNPHYHQPTDTPDTLDYDFLRRSTRSVADAVLRFARAASEA